MTAQIPYALTGVLFAFRSGRHFPFSSTPSHSPTTLVRSTTSTFTGDRRNSSPMLATSKRESPAQTGLSSSGRYRDRTSDLLRLKQAVATQARTGSCLTRRVVSMWSAGWPVRQTATSAESNSVTRGAKLKCIRCDEPIGEGPCGPSMPTRTPRVSESRSREDPREPHPPDHRRGRMMRRAGDERKKDAPVSYQPRHASWLGYISRRPGIGSRTTEIPSRS
jgi:hypothetical protein